MPTSRTERLGIAALDTFFSTHGWLFREQTTHDYGIDAHVEIVDENHRPTGKLIAIQIKSGTSFFKKQTPKSFVFRTNDKHVAYWIGHSMPVIVVLYNPMTKTAHWKQVTRRTTKQAGNSWKIHVPKSDMLADPVRTLASLEALTQPEPYLRRLNRLRVDRHWMGLIEAGEVVRVKFDDWVNKSLPRYQIRIFTDADEETWPTLYTPGVGVEGMLKHFFPWAKLEVDEGEFEEGAKSDWEAASFQHHDPETGKTTYSQEFEDWYEPPNGLVPVSDNGETQTYVLILSLNKFGKAFIAVDDYLSDPDAPENIGFSM